VNELVTNAADAADRASGSDGGNGTEHLVGGKHDGLAGLRLKRGAQGATVVGDDGEQHQSGGEGDEGKLIAPSGGNVDSSGFSGSGNRGAGDGKKSDVFESIWEDIIVHAVTYAFRVPTYKRKHKSLL